MRRLPVPVWIATYQRDWLPHDIIGGLTAAAVVIPMAMAYATIADLPLQVGLYTALVPMVVYSAFGSSLPLSVSTTSTISILVGAQLGPIAFDGNLTLLWGALATLTLSVGFILILAAVLRLGFVAHFISYPVLVGFKAGIGLVIMLDQVPKILGIYIHKASFAHNLLATVANADHLSIAALIVGLASIGVLIVVEHRLPRGPAPLIAVSLGIVAMAALHLDSFGVRTIGRIPEGLPRLTVPDFSRLEHLLLPAMGIALMSLTETIAAGRAFVTKDEPMPHANRELLATGLANVAGALLGSMPAGGGTSQTAVNRLAGARSQLASLITAGITLLTMLVLAPLVQLMPQPTLAALVLVYSASLIQPTEFRAIYGIRKREFLWSLAAAVGVLLLGTLEGIAVAIFVSLLALSYQVTNPPVYEVARKRGTNVFRPRSVEHPDDETFPGLLLMRTEGMIFFINAERIGEKMRALAAQSKPRVIAIDMSGVPDLEYTALRMLTEAEKKNREHGLLIWLTGLEPSVLATVQNSPLGKALVRDGLFFNLEQAVARYQTLYAEQGDRGSVVVG